MAKIQVRFDDVKSGDFAIVPDDLYSLRATKCIVKQGPSGYPNLVWICEIFNNEIADLNGQIIGLMTSMAPDALWKVKDLLEKGEVEWSEDSFETDDAVGMEFGADLIQDVFEGEDRMKSVKFYKI